MRLFAGVLGVLVLFGCGSGLPDGFVLQQSTLDPAYVEAMDELTSGNYIEAAERFDKLANNSLDSLVQQLAQLRLGDALFMQGRPLEAAEVYREYVIQHPNSPDAPHAAYMRGLCYFRRIPGDSWILPPSSGREMLDVNRAYDALVAVVDNYPNSYFAVRARHHISILVDRKCRNHLYVAEFYWDRENYGAVAQRIEAAMELEQAQKAMQHVPDSFSCATQQDVLLRLAEVYYILGDTEGFTRAKAYFESNKKRYVDPTIGETKIRNFESTFKPAAAKPEPEETK